MGASSNSPETNPMTESSDSPEIEPVRMSMGFTAQEIEALTETAIDGMEALDDAAIRMHAGRFVGIVSGAISRLVSEHVESRQD